VSTLSSFATVNHVASLKAKTHTIATLAATRCAGPTCTVAAVARALLTATTATPALGSRAHHNNIGLGNVANLPLPLKMASNATRATTRCVLPAVTARERALAPPTDTAATHALVLRVQPTSTDQAAAQAPPTATHATHAAIFSAAPINIAPGFVQAHPTVSNATLAMTKRAVQTNTRSAVALAPTMGMIATAATTYNAVPTSTRPANALAEPTVRCAFFDCNVHSRSAIEF
jgi:hypothetical protein